MSVNNNFFHLINLRFTFLIFFFLSINCEKIMKNEPHSFSGHKVRCSTKSQKHKEI